MHARLDIKGRRLTAKKSDLGDVPRISQASDSNVLIIDTGRVLRVEEKRHGTRVSAKADMTIAIPISIAMAKSVMKSRRGTAVDERAGLVGRPEVCWFVRH